MCGIVGIVERRGDDPGAHLAAMRDRLRHRGPDDEGLRTWPADGVGLAFRRLAILDTRPAGNQPMRAEGGDAWIVFNGEIYNFPELRRELVSRGRRFATRTDTEVLIQAYAEWGVGCVERLRGMFAFAIWDEPRKRLLLARDPLGIKPLYVFTDERRLVFASEAKAILAHPGVPRRPQPAALVDYLAYGYVPWDRAAFAGMRKLPPGHLLLVEGGGEPQTREYWRPSPHPGDTPPDALLEELRCELQRAVAEQMVSDVPLGAFLSGGLDSSLVTALMSRASDEPVRTVSIGFDRGVSETGWARMVAEAYGTRHHEEMVDDSLAAPLLDELSWAYDEPLADPSTVPTFRLCKAAAERVTVALSGDGGDELFAGYDWYGAPAAADGAGAALLRGLVRRLRSLPVAARGGAMLRRLEPDPALRHLRHAGLFDPWELDQVAGPALRPFLADHDPAWLFRRFLRPDLPSLTALQLLDLRTFLLDDILVKVDRAGMAASLEVRPPLLDPRLVDIAFRVPAALQRDADGGKAFLKAATADLLPAAIYQRPKKGFRPPLSQWLRDGLWNLLERRILDGALVRDGLVEAAYVGRMVRHLTERRWAKAWALLTLEQWYRRWIDGPRDAAFLRS